MPVRLAIPCWNTGSAEDDLSLLQPQAVERMHTLTIDLSVLLPVI